VPAHRNVDRAFADERADQFVIEEGGGHFAIVTVDAAFTGDEHVAHQGAVGHHRLAAADRIGVGLAGAVALVLHPTPVHHQHGEQLVAMAPSSAASSAAIVAPGWPGCAIAAATAR